jgi:hypothetical protein
MSRGDLTRELDRLGIHPVDIVEALDAADVDFEHGTTEQTQRWRRVRDRIASGLSSQDDLQAVARELLDPTSTVDKVFLIGMIGLAGPSPASLNVLTSFVDARSDPTLAQVALNVLVGWDETGVPEVIGRLLGARAELDPDLLEWVIAAAGDVILKRRTKALFSALESIATNPSEPVIVRKSAIAVIARVAGFGDEAAVRAAVASVLDNQPFDSILADARSKL